MNLTPIWPNMWIDRDIAYCLQHASALPVKVLTGPRQVGKTSLLEKLKGYESIYFDDLSVRRRAKDDPRFFLDQYPSELILDEATLVPEIFFELKRRVDEERRHGRSELNIWVTGSNQTLLQRSVQESLAGRASYFTLGTLSLHELGEVSLPTYMMNGGWPELYSQKNFSTVRYLNDLIATFIERDIVNAAGIEKQAAFSKCLQLIAGRVGQLFNASDIAKTVSVDVATVRSWVRILERNGILKEVPSYSSNLNKRLIKAPKIYFEDVGLAVRLQGWSEYNPLHLSPAYGLLFENMVLSEISRFLSNNGQNSEIYFVRTKEKVEVDFLVSLPNNRFISMEVKAAPQLLSEKQVSLLDSLQIDIVERWIVTPNESYRAKTSRVVRIHEIWQHLQDVW